jgi:4-amino-4-deoxy-L-arabinose transferase-like glycosyltransferase
MQMIPILVQSKTLTLLTVFVIALMVRLFSIFLIPTYQFDSEWQYGYEFARIAKWILAGEGFSSPYYDFPKPSANQAPLYVYFIALVFSLFGTYSVASAVMLLITQAVIDALACVASYFVGNKIFGEKVGLLGALALALYPPSIFFATWRVEPVVVIVLILTVLVYYLLKLAETPSCRTAVVCGLLMGLAALTEPTLISFMILTCLWLFWYSASPRIFVAKRVGILGLVSVMVILPWMLRNYTVFGTIVPIKSNFGANLLFGNNQYGNGVLQYTKGFYSVEERERIIGRRESPHRLQKPPLFSEAEQRAIRELSEVDADRLMLEKAVGFITAQPWTFLELTGRRIFAFWSPVNPYRTTRYDALRGKIYGVVLTFALLGILLARHSLGKISLILLLFLSYPLSYYITHVSMYRYRYPVEPFLILLGCYGVLELYERVRLSVGRETSCQAGIKKHLRHRLTLSSFSRYRHK